jgi:hypothetical protein
MSRRAHMDLLRDDLARALTSRHGRAAFLANAVSLLWEAKRDMTDVEQRVIGTAVRACKALHEMEIDHEKIEIAESLGKEVENLKRQIEESRNGGTRASSAPRFSVPEGAGATRQ